jgi:hypothetical protein
MVKVIVSPQSGGSAQFTSSPVALTGERGYPKQATVSVTLPGASVGIISALIDSVLPEPNQ